LEELLQAMVRDPNVGEISILAHSMGNFVAVEAIRQMKIRNGALSPKIADIMLAAPDIDFDVFRRQIAEIETSGKSPPITLFVSQDDRALSISRSLAGDAPRLGAIDPSAEPFRSILADERINVIDLSKVKSDDSLNHGKFAQSSVVKAIGSRLASGQILTDANATLGERLGGVALGATDTLGKAATLVISAPAAIVDPDTRETLGDEAAALGSSAANTARAPVAAFTQR
jgi:esterase/lipase superfamily enzyme